MRLLLGYVLLCFFLSGCTSINPSGEVKVDVPVSRDLEYVTSDAGIWLFRDGGDQIVALNSQGETVYTLPKSELMVARNGVVETRQENEWRLFDCQTGQELRQEDFALTAGILDTVDELNPYQGENGLWGYIDRQARWIIPPQYSHAEPFTDRIAYVESDEGRTSGFVDREGNFEPVCIEGPYWEEVFSEGIMRLQYIINDIAYSTFVTNQNEVLPSMYPAKRYGYPYGDARPFQEGFAAVQVNGKWGYIDSTGEVKIEPTYQNAYSFSDGYAVVVKQDGSFGTITKGGAESDFLQIKGYAPTGLYADGLYVVESDQHMENIVDEEGKLLLDEDVHFIHKETRAEIPVWWIYEKGFYLPQTRTFIPGENNTYHENVMTVDGSRMYDLNTGELLWQGAVLFDFSDGCAVAISKNRYGYLDVTGQWIIEPCFQRATNAYGGVAFVELVNGEQGFIQVRVGQK